MDDGGVLGGAGEKLAHGLGMATEIEGTTKVRPYAFSALDETDFIENEIEEFYSYVEAPLFAENRAQFYEWVHDKAPSLGLSDDIGAWTALPRTARRRIMLRLLASLDLESSDARLRAAQALLYLLQGNCQDAVGEAEQMHWIRENAALVLELHGLDDMYMACRRACWRHDLVSAVPDAAHSPDDARTYVLSPQTKAELLDEINLEITILFSHLYMVIETHRTDDAVACALMTMDPPLPVYLWGLVADLREKSIKGFPVKKLVLLLWKCMLAITGGNDALPRCEALAREREGLAPAADDALTCPALPSDVHAFRQDLAAKYPTLAPPRLADELMPGEMLAGVTAPLPASGHVELPANSAATIAEDERAMVAKAASAPPPIKMGRQKFQTDQSRPFLLPLEPKAPQHNTVPESIREAEALYRMHMHVPTGLWQMWRTRQALLKDLYGTDDAELAHLTAHMAATSLETQRPPAVGDSADAQRLAWVERLYRGMLPSMQSAVIVLLKLMLATTTSGGTGSAYMRATADGTPSEQAPAPTLEDLDIVRHREILNKGISSLLLLCLRWFRANHVLQFEYLAQILLDSNVMLLILKLFGLHEVSQQVRSRCEAHNFALFTYCALAGREGAPETPQSLLAQSNLRIGDVWSECTDDPPRVSHAPAGMPKTTAYSWRNLRTAIDLTRLLYHVCEHKTHRIMLLVQYKSSAILKRSLKVPQPDLELAVLELLKMQIPFCGRKWRQSNMRIITQIYLRCQPSLRDEWPGGFDMEAEIEASLSEEQTLRSLIQFFNRSRSQFQPPAPPPTHDEPAATAAEPDASAAADAGRGTFEQQAFPVRRAPVSSATPGRYIFGEGLVGSMEAFEDMMQEAFASVPLESLLPPPDAESSSRRSSSAVTSTPEGQNDWEHLSPREMTILSRTPLSPHLVRRRSQGSGTSPPMRLREGHHRNVSLSLATAAGTTSRHRRINSTPGMEHPALHWSIRDLVQDAISSEEGDGTTEAASLPESDEPLPTPQPGGIDEVEHIFGA